MALVCCHHVNGILRKRYIEICLLKRYQVYCRGVASQPLVHEGCFACLLQLPTQWLEGANAVILGLVLVVSMSRGCMSPCKEGAACTGCCYLGPGSAQLPNTRKHPSDGFLI